MKNARNFIFGKFGLKILVFENHNHHILMHFVLKFQCFELILNVFQKTVFFLKFSESLPISIDPFYFSINLKFLNMLERASVCFDRSKLIFDWSNSFKIVLLKSLSVSIDRGCFSIDWNSWIMFFFKSDWTFSKALFQTLFKLFSLSPTWLGSTKDFFVVFFQNFCKVFVFQGR